MSTPFIGQIMIVGFNFAPRGWAFCNGQILSIAQNTALFSLLGTTYGGNGTTTFALPNLQGRMPLHFGQGPGLSNRSLGQASGTETHTLIQTEMPAHNHSAAMNGNSSTANAGSPAGNTLANTGRTNIYSNSAPNVAMAATSITTGVAGGSQPHNNMPPFLALNFVIALQGIYPSRN